MNSSSAPTQLVESVKALEVCYDMDSLTYTQAANHLSAAVSYCWITKWHAVFQMSRLEVEVATSRDVFVAMGIQSMQLTA